MSRDLQIVSQDTKNALGEAVPLHHLTGSRIIGVVGTRTGERVLHEAFRMGLAHSYVPMPHITVRANRPLEHGSCRATVNVTKALGGVVGDSYRVAAHTSAYTETVR